MNIKSLLLGSAAALVAVSGARAADAVNVVVEPEPAEYVRVCDTYGTGYFYIPGTETCLRIGGYVRFEARAGDGPYGGVATTDRMDQTSNDTYNHYARLALRTWTGTETELGTLSSYTETRFNYHDLDGSTSSLNFAWLQLGGFRVGKDESAYVTFTGYAGNVVGDDLVAFGPFDTNLISYAFDAGNGLSGIVSLETGKAGSNFEIDSYVPHIVGGVKYAGGWGSVTGVVGYDSVWEDWAGKVRADVNVNEQISVFVMGGYGTDDNVANSNFKPWAGDWAVWGGGSYKLNDKTTFNTQVSYEEGTGDEGNWGAVANVNYTVVKGFVVTPEISYYDEAGASGEVGGLVRFQRNF